MGKNTVERDGIQTTVRRMRIACWIPKATDTHSESVILSVFRQLSSNSRIRMEHPARFKFDVFHPEVFTEYVG
jgi:hypothetical protein